MDEGPGIIAGLNEILNHEKVRKDVDLKKLEQEMAKDYKFDIASSVSVDPLQKFTTDIGSYARELGINQSDLNSGRNQKNSRVENFARTGTMIGSDFNNRKSGYNSSSSRSSMSSRSSRSSRRSRRHNKHNDDSSDTMSISGASQSSGYSTDANSVISTKSYFDRGHNNPFMERGGKLDNMTVEQTKQAHINNVLHNLNVTSGNAIFSLQEEEKNSEKMRFLEQIEQMTKILENSGNDVTKYKNLSMSNSYEEVEIAFKMLRNKMDTDRGVTIANEGILLLAHIAEKVFDGKKEYFGRKPDLTDWSTTVYSKLDRMSYDTSNMVNTVVQTFSLPSPVKMALELVPSAILHASKRSATAGEPGLQLNNDYNEAIHDLDKL